MCDRAGTESDADGRYTTSTTWSAGAAPAISLSASRGIGAAARGCTDDRQNRDDLATASAVRFRRRGAGAFIGLADEAPGGLAAVGSRDQKLEAAGNVVGADTFRGGNSIGSGNDRRILRAVGELSSSMRTAGSWCTRWRSPLMEPSPLIGTTVIGCGGGCSCDASSAGYNPSDTARILARKFDPLINGFPPSLPS
jgi:hypothetical protein